MAEVAGQTRYWCHQCEDQIETEIMEEGEMACRRCKGTFVEEIEEINPPPQDQNSANARNASGARRVIVLEDGASVLPFQARPRVFVMRQGSGDTEIPLPGGIFGDYFLGNGIETLLQRLMENDPNHYGSPPAAPAAVESMPTIRVSCDSMKSDEYLSCDKTYKSTVSSKSGEGLNSGDLQCPVCFDDFEIGGEAKQMPCKHIFHEYCILPWLKMHNTCPVCRYEMPIADPESDAEKRQREEEGRSGEGGGESAERQQTGTAGEGDAGAGNVGRVLRREFTFAVPWNMVAQLLSAGREGGSNATGDQPSLD
eukprot:TRINITY_DN5753_c1_g1_i5.p1 TRINITY_DN5753_c1_g1~~TRINITY_DN5753_c1_g1_i5.p1  ORF type:complete len:311 (-),score=16.26 TRINITY_DN5753_c1_g1_i5:148-1080(-)